MFFSTSQIYLLIASLQYFGVQALPFRKSSQTDLVPRALGANLVDESIFGLAQGTKGLGNKAQFGRPFFEPFDTTSANALGKTSVGGPVQIPPRQVINTASSPIKPIAQFGRPFFEHVDTTPANALGKTSVGGPVQIPPPNIASSIKLQPQSGLTPKPNVPNNPRKSGGDNIFLNQVGTEGLSGAGGLSNTGKVAAGGAVAATGIGAVAGGAALVNNLGESQSSTP